ncbi:MAG: gcvT 1, partial [Devosia sp.]|nr:gcvT 1 [Devosia sp.]
MSSFRIPGKGRVDTSKPVQFLFNGKTFSGFEGDTVASALLASGQHLVGRSFKYHRPRGILSAGSEEPNALLGIDHGPGRIEPNSRATVVEISPGLKTISQNHWPSLERDVGAINDVLYMLFSAGFYYKTFMWPKSFWNKVYEPIIRGTAGLGKSPTVPDPDTYSSRFAHYDVLVVGAGPAGLAAALQAGRSGAKVLLVDEQAELGGSLLSETNAGIDGATGLAWLKASVAELAGMANVTLLPRTTAIGYYHQNFVGLCQRITDHLASAPEGTPRERMWKVRAKQVVLAQGAIEKPLVFDGNDRPGVMLASAARAYLNRYGVKIGNSPVVVTSHDSAWLAAFDLARAGVKVAAIIDIRPTVPAHLTASAKALGIEVLLGWTVTGTKGRLRISSL